MTTNDSSQRVGRRAFLRDGALVLGTMAGAASIKPLLADRPGNDAAVRAGLITDLHYADKPAAGSRHYRQTLAKLEEAGNVFRNSRLDFIVELGDLVDAADTVDTEQKWLQRVNKELATISPQRHYVLGNHCVHTLKKEEFLGGIERERSWYSFDVDHCHFVVLDACFRADGVAYGRRNFQWTDPNIPEPQLEWLRDDLRQSEKPTIVFVHQRLDVSNQHGVKNAAQVRAAFREGDVRAVFQGHSHANDYRDIDGVHYCTLVAMVEGAGASSNAYSTLWITPEGTIVVGGFRRQRTYGWS